MDIVKGLELGADDYITKPFSLSVLRARVNTQLRKAESLQAHTSASVYKKGCYEFDFERMIFLVDGQEIELSKTEQRLLRLLVQNEGIISAEIFFWTESGMTARNLWMPMPSLCLSRGSGTSLAHRTALKQYME